MRIAIDARWIFKEISGIGTYTQELIRELARIDRRNDYILLFDNYATLETTSEHTQFNAAPNFRSHVVPYGVFSLQNQLRMPGQLLDLNIDIFHSPNFMIPFRAFPRSHHGRIKCIVTIHDLIPLIFPDHAPRSKKAKYFMIYKWIMNEVGRRADRILTVSESSRMDILQHLHISRKRSDIVSAIYNGVSPDYKPPIVKKPSKIPTILYVGRLDPYKNVISLIDAYAQMLDEGHLYCQLNIIGPNDDRYPEARERAKEMGVEGRINWLGYAAADDLLKHYQQSDLLVLPSRYEGFGLPVLEAMACGTPVICSNISSLPEVGGDAARLVDPEDTYELAQAMRSILTDKVLAQDMAHRGLKQASRFTWERCAKETLGVYELVSAAADATAQ